MKIDTEDRALIIGLAFVILMIGMLVYAGVS